MKKKIYGLAFLFFLLDLVSKVLITHFLELSSSIKIIDKFFYLTYVQNKGAAFSILENKQVLILLVTLFVLFFLNNYLTKTEVKKKEILAHSMIIGGILGNLFDRLVYGYVIDFLSFHFGSFNYPVFNLADTFIVIGAFLLMFLSFRGGNNGSTK